MANNLLAEILLVRELLKLRSHIPNLHHMTAINIFTEHFSAAFPARQWYNKPVIVPQTTIVGNHYVPGPKASI